MGIRAGDDRIIHPGHRNFDDLTDKQQKFVDSYLRNGDKFVAYEEAGFSMSTRGWKAAASKLFRQMADVIRDRIDQKIGEDAMVALSIVRELMVSPDVSPAVRLNAAKDYLSRAGYDKVETQRIEIDDKRNLSDDDLDKELNALLQGKLNVELDTGTTG